MRDQGGDFVCRCSISLVFGDQSLVTGMTRDSVNLLCFLCLVEKMVPKKEIYGARVPSDVANFNCLRVTIAREHIDGVFVQMP